MSAYSVYIQPVVVAKPGTKIDLMLQYVFDASDANVFVILKDIDDNTLQTYNVYIPPEIYSSWKEDSVIVDYALAALNFTRI